MLIAQQDISVDNPRECHGGIAIDCCKKYSDVN